MNEPKTNKQAWLSTISNMLQFILGFLLGVALIAGSAVAVAYYYFTKMSSSVPEKPIYTEEKSPTTKVADNQTTITTKKAQPDTISPVSSKTPDLQSQSTTEENLPDGAYYAKVTWTEGLSLRAEPSVTAAKIGGIDYNSKILILEESSDKQWQKVQIPWSEQEGWVKAGNVERTFD